MPKHRTLILIWSICLTLIGIAVGVRISNIPSGDHTASNDNSNYIDQIPSLEESFYEETDKKAGTKSVPATSRSATPVISARAYLAGNVVTKEIYFEKNANTVLPVASMSKLITAFAVTDMLPLDTMVTITPEAFNVASDTSKLIAGESFSIKELLYPLLLNSSNVAAEALASFSNRSSFLESMVGYAWEVGMPKTLFADPSGISPGNVSTARDFFALAQYLYKSRTDILAITKIPKLSIATTTINSSTSSGLSDSTTTLIGFDSDPNASTTNPAIIISTTTIEHNAHDFTNIHPFVFDPAFLGGKTGHTTEAKDTMLTIMNIKDRPIAIIVIASDNRKRDTILIIDKLKALLK